MIDIANNPAGQLARQLDAFTEALLGRAEPRTAATLRRMQEGVCAGFADLRPRAVGEIAPDFTLPDQGGTPVTLTDVLSRGPVMLTFFRGGWCPFCAISLRAFAQLHKALRRQGASLLAISPQGVAENATTASENGLGFPILADRGHDIADRFGLLWRMDAEMRELYQRLGHDIPALTGTKEWALPIPASFVIAPGGRIVFAHVDPRVTKRVEPEDVLVAVRGLAGSKTLAASPVA